MLRAESIVLFLVFSFALSISAVEIGLQNRNGTSKNSSTNESVMEKCNKTFQISAGDTDTFGRVQAKKKTQNEIVIQFFHKLI